MELVLLEEPASLGLQGGGRCWAGRAAVEKGLREGERLPGCSILIVVCNQKKMSCSFPPWISSRLSEV